MMRLIPALVLSLLAATAHAAGQDAKPAPEQVPAKRSGPDFSQYPQTSISNQLVTVRLYLPDAENGYYRGTRFDWSGMISSVEYNGHKFFCEFKEQQHDPYFHDDVCGTAEELSMTTTPPGFAEAKPGEEFMKIGIGVLEKGTDPDYAFGKKYKISKPGTWKITLLPSSVEFAQALQGPAGYSYEYTKTVRLAAGTPELTISRRLKNTGSKPIETDHYGHNFLKIDNLPAGPGYVLDFPFAPRFGEGSQAQGCVELKGNSLVYLKPLPGDEAVWVRLDGFTKPEDNLIKVTNRRTDASFTIATDQPLARLAFYSSGGVLCPEPFVKVSVAPGETKQWTTTYRFAATAK